MAIVQLQSSLKNYRQEIQTAHGFVVNNVLRYNGTDYVLAQADSSVNAENVVGVVTAVVDANTFRIGLPGFPQGSGYTPGSTYYLSTATAGGTQTTAPTAAGTVNLPLGVGIEGGQLLPQAYLGFQTV